MKREQIAMSGSKLTLREQYRQVAIKLLCEEQPSILDIKTLRELIELELERSIKTDELIAAFKRRDDGLEIVIHEEMIWVVYEAPLLKKETGMPNSKKTTGKKAAKKSTEGKLSPADFTLAAIRDLRKPPHKGIHSVYSKFNAAFRKYFPELDLVATLTELAKNGTIISKRTRGGALLYIPGENPAPKEKVKKKVRPAPKDPADEALKKMGLM
jgi:hypothetical protein